MKKLIVFILLCTTAILLIISTGCKQSSMEPADSGLDSLNFPPHAKKPNIYIYPTATCSMSVKLEFPLGGTIIKSEPDYGTGWNIKVDPSGKINDEYDYLFYESVNPDRYQYTSGWVVCRDSLLTFFTNNLLEAGFTQRETNDFTEYWVPRLIDDPYYIIYPQSSENINKVIRLEFSIQPDNVLRYFYVIKGTNSNNINLNVPVIPKFERSGFIVAEWGVVM